MRPRRVRIAQGQMDPLAETAGAPPRRRADRRPSMLRYTLFSVGLLGVGVAGLAATNLYMALDAEEVAGWVSPRASAVLNRPVTLGGAGLSIWPRPSVRVTDVEIGNLADFDGPTLARIDAARLDVSWLPLVIGRVRVERLVLEGAQLHMAIDEQGKSNFGDLVPSSEELEPLPAPVALRIREVSLSDGSLSFFDAEGGRSLAVSGIDAEAVLSPTEGGGWSSTLAARSDSLLVRLAGIGGEIVRGAGPSAVVLAHGGGASPSGITIDEGHVAFAGDTLAVYGVVSAGSPVPSTDLLFTADSFSTGFLGALFPAEVRSHLLPRAEGSLQVMIQLEGGADAPPSLRGSIGMRDVGLRLRGEPLIEAVSGVVALTRDTIAFDSLAGRFAGGDFELSGTVAREAGVAAIVARASPRLDAPGLLALLPEGTTLSGDAELYLSLVGPARSLDSVEVVGVAGLSGLQLEHPRLGVPLSVPSGEISLVGREVRWSEVAVLLGQDRVMTSGSVLDPLALRPGAEQRPLVELSISAPRIDLARALIERDTVSEATYAHLALAHLGDRAVDERTATAVMSARGIARPHRLTAVGTVDLSVDTLVLRRRTVASVRARLELQDTALRVSDLSFEAWDGRATASLHLGVGPNPAEPFALALSVEGARAEQFLAAMSPLGDAVSGTLDLSLDVRGATDAALLPLNEDLEGRLDMSIADGVVAGTGVNMALADFLGDEGWTDVAFTDWALDIGIRDGVLDIREGSLDAEAGEVVFSGPLRLDGSADLSIALSIPPEHLDGVSLRRTGIGQSVLDRLRAAGGSLDLGLHLSGWLQAPTLEPDASQAVASAR